MGIKPPKNFWIRALALVEGRRHDAAVANKPAEPHPGALPETGSCAACSFSASGAASPLPLCRQRNFSIVNPERTWCRNFTSRHPSPQGAIHHVWPSGSRSPWVGLIAPHTATGVCEVCGRKVKNGIGIDLLEGSFRACGEEHYFAWWVDYQEQRLAFFKHTGEKILSDFCDLLSFTSAAASYNDAREAFEDAIAVARDLERPEEIEALEARLQYIRKIFQNQARPGGL